MYDYHVVINVEKCELLNKLNENRERYVNSVDALKTAWAELNTVYQKDYAEWSAKYVAETLGKDETKPVSPAKIQDKTDDYNLWVEMLENAVGDHIELNKENFNLLWRDNWGWMLSHTNTIRAYACSDMGSFSISTSALLATSVTAYNISL